MSTKCNWLNGFQHFYNTPMFISAGEITTNTTFSGTAETVLYTETVYANTFNSTGMHFRVTLAGTISSDGTDDITFRLRYGTTDILETVVTTNAPNEDDKAFKLVYEGRVHTTGATGKVVAVGLLENEMTGMANVLKTTAAAGVTVNLTADGSLNITGQWDTTSADTDVVITSGMLQLFN